jgi:hypothetical protein
MLRNFVMSNNSSGPCGVSPDEPKAKSASVRGFESHPPHYSTNPPLSQSIVGEIVSFALWMKKQGKYLERMIE